MNRFKLLTLCALLVAITAMGTLYGCTRPINRAAERKVRDALPKLLGEAKSYQVKIDNDPFKTISGSLANVRIDGTDVKMQNGLLLDHLQLDLKGVKVDTKKGVVQEVREANFIATVGKAALDEYMTGADFPVEGLKRVRVQLLQDKVTISAEQEIVQFRVPLLKEDPFKISVPFSVTGPLRIAGPRRVEFDPTRFNVIGISVSGRPLSFVKDRFERAVDLDAFPFPVTLTNIGTAPNQLILYGTADVVAILKSQGLSK